MDIKTRTAVIVLDYQKDILSGYAPDPAGVIKRGGALLNAARNAGLPIFFVRVQFRPGYPEISDRNVMFCGVREGSFLSAADDGAQIPEALVRAGSDIILDKYRVGAFESTPLSMMLRAQDIEALIIFGVSTSGCVLSTVRHAADLDYRLIVVEDLCADLEAEVHDMLVKKVFPTQAAVCRAEDVIAAL